MSHKLILISFDALVGEDVSYLRSKPDSHFNRVFGRGSGVKRLKSIYPSITYPVHFSLASGCYPGKTGFYHNYYSPEDPLKRKGWILESNHCPVEDFFAAAKRARKTTASVYWPSMANNPNIDYLINEYVFPDPQEDILEAFARQGANEAALNAVKEAMPYFPFGYRGRKIPTIENSYDDFLIACFCNLVREHKPDFAVVHHCFMDTIRHRYGIFGPQVQAGADYVDACIGRIADTLEEAGIYENTDILIVSDHGQLEFQRYIKLNRLLEQAGFLSVTPDGQLDQWEARVESNGMSACVYLRDKNDSELYQRVYTYLNKLAQEGVWGFQEVMTEERSREQYQLYGDFSFVLETDGYTCFHGGLTGKIVLPTVRDSYLHSQATHGYAPEKGPQPVLCAAGPSFRQGVYLEDANVVDVAPTVAALMGQTMPQAQGRVLTELLK